MNKATAMNALESGATLTIDCRANAAWLRFGATDFDFYIIPREIAAELAAMPFLNKISSWKGIDEYSVKMVNN